MRGYAVNDGLDKEKPEGAKESQVMEDHQHRWLPCGYGQAKHCPLKTMIFYTALLLGAFPECPAIAKRAVAELEVWDPGNGLNAHEGVGGK